MTPGIENGGAEKVPTTKAWVPGAVAMGLVFGIIGVSYYLDVSVRTQLHTSGMRTLVGIGLILTYLARSGYGRTHWKMPNLQGVAVVVIAGWTMLDAACAFDVRYVEPLVHPSAPIRPESASPTAKPSAPSAEAVAQGASTGSLALDAAGGAGGAPQAPGEVDGEFLGLFFMFILGLGAALEGMAQADGKGGQPEANGE